jgi:hypothetical protein
MSTFCGRLARFLVGERNSYWRDCDARDYSDAIAVGERLDAAAELATGQKLAAVGASAAALAGAGTAIDELTSSRPPAAGEFAP